MLGSKSPPGMGFQILLKLGSPFTGTKRNGCFDPPRAVFGCVRNLALVMGFQPGFNIFGKSRVMAGFVCLADQDIYIMKCLRGYLFNIRLARAKFETHFIKEARFRLATTPWQAPFSIASGLPGRSSRRSRERSLVPVVGIEPTCPCGRRILSPLRLPVPPHRLASWLLKYSITRH